MHIERVIAPTPEIVGAVARLVPQLTSNNPAPTEPQLAAMLRSEFSVLLIARHGDLTAPIVGMGSLGVYRVPTGVRAVIEDVVVDEAVRGLGIGAAITLRLLEHAREMGAAGATLTSNARRQAANRLYLRLGFTRRETNCYYYAFR
jgi:ribosomal protein S18 acetylase RimI-like enzyme